MNAVAGALVDLCVTQKETVFCGVTPLVPIYCKAAAALAGLEPLHCSGFSVLPAIGGFGYHVSR